MRDAKMLAINPVLPSQDVLMSIAFFNKLGFNVAFQDDPQNPYYAGVRRDNIEIHIQWHDVKEWQAVERPMLRIKVEGIEALYQAFSGNGLFHKETLLRETSWGTKEFAFFDPFQNGLTFYSDR